MDRPGSTAAATRPGHLAHGNAYAGAALGSVRRDRDAPLTAIHTHAPSGFRCSARGARDRGKRPSKEVDHGTDRRDGA
jgi:hypothetical protein